MEHTESKLSFKLALIYRLSRMSCPECPDVPLLALWTCRLISLQSSKLTRDDSIGGNGAHRYGCEQRLQNRKDSCYSPCMNRWVDTSGLFVATVPSIQLLPASRQNSPRTSRQRHLLYWMVIKMGNNTFETLELLQEFWSRNDFQCLWRGPGC